MADPRTARKRALADIQQTQERSAIQAITTFLMGQSAANAAATRGRASVDEADAAAAPPPVDVTQFFQGGNINPTDPIGSLQRLGFSTPSAGRLAQAGPGGLAQAGPGGARGGQFANQSIVAARQAAGTAPSPAPSPEATQVAQAGGGQVTVGDQTFTAPSEIVATRETTAPFEFGPGSFVPATTREVTRTPNVLSAGDILATAQRQQEFQSTQRQRIAEFTLSHALQTEQSKATVALDILRTTKAPGDVAANAAAAVIGGDTKKAAELLAPFETVGQASIAAQRASVKRYEALAQKAEIEAGLAAGSLSSSFAAHFNIPPGSKPLTADNVLGVQEKIADDLSKLYGKQGQGLFAPDVTPSQRASLIDNIGKRAASIDQALIFPNIDGKATPIQIPASTAIALLTLANGGESDDPNAQATIARARRAVQALGIGFYDTTRERLTPTGVSEEVAPYAESLQNAWRTYSDEVLQHVLNDPRIQAAVTTLLDNVVPAAPKKK